MTFLIQRNDLRKESTIRYKPQGSELLIHYIALFLEHDAPSAPDHGLTPSMHYPVGNWTKPTLVDREPLQTESGSFPWDNCLHSTASVAMLSGRFEKKPPHAMTLDFDDLIKLIRQTSCDIRVQSQNSGKELCETYLESSDNPLDVMFGLQGGDYDTIAPIVDCHSDLSRVETLPSSLDFYMEVKQLYQYALPFRVAGEVTDSYLRIQQEAKARAETSRIKEIRSRSRRNLGLSCLISLLAFILLWAWTSTSL